ncbi:Hemolysin, contains CBS domains [Brevibacterium sandarakinum]|uniref:Hemolysin, contains CBS domains n=1 Tax=Brevibacterium sandarakinum TaxID=629680 RepID=A0A1H1QTY8_BRESA|nr:hemolysin family protein [Brevibacterium sandarakinum]SDS26951.1 Hemolysin, contains CBS domains [Brevibacterium sandarakinum]
MSNPWVIIALTVLFIGLSAFFVAVEFALIAAKRHRLEDAAADNRSARAALRSSTELSVLLAGSQLGITACTLALGAITKPAVHHWITPVAEAMGLPLWIADLTGFVLALIVVTFLHLVVGEMAPKSWAVAHPERSAILLALPMRAFMFLTRPLLHVLNNAANACLRLVGVEPVDEVDQGHTSDDLRELLRHSAQAGTIERESSDALLGALELTQLSLGELVAERGQPTAVGPGATVTQVREAAQRDRHRRILVHTVSGQPPTHVVHVRDVLGLAGGDTITEVTRPVEVLPAPMTVGRAFGAMKAAGTQLALVERVDGRPAVITVTDVLTYLLSSGSVEGRRS